MREMIMRVLIDNHGSNSCQAWIDSLEKQDLKAYKKLRQHLDYLELFGNDMLKGGRKPKDIKPLTDVDGLWEIRIDDYRVLFFYFDGDTLVVTNGFSKKRKTTPQSAITKGLQIKKHYK